MSKKKKTANNKDSTSFIVSIISFIRSDKLRISLGSILIFASIFLLISFISYLFTWKEDQSKLLLKSSEIVVDNWAGKLGASVSHTFFHNWFGLPSFLLLFILVISSLALFKIKTLPLLKTTKYLVFATLWFSITLGYLAGEGDFYPGGAYGFFTSKWLNAFAGKVGTLFIIVLSGFIFAIFTFHSFYLWVVKSLNESVSVIKPANINNNETIIENQSNKSDVTDNFEFEINKEQNEGMEDSLKEKEEIINENTVFFETINNKSADSKEDVQNIDMKQSTIKSEDDDSDLKLMIEKPIEEVLEEKKLENYDPKLDLSNYKYPGFDLLNDYDQGNTEVTENELIANKDKIVETLGHYGISIKKIKATIGPTVTLYEIIPAPGVKISKIRNLEDDIALSLAALGIRIIAPIPGKGTIGIEVPNLKAEIVPMKSVLASQKFREMKAELPIVLGKTIQNESFAFDLAKAPHLLVAGATGMGKSVGLNVILSSLLYTKHPSELKLVLIDPKKLEFTPYVKTEKHFLAKLPDEDDPIITDTKKVVATLRSLTIEMDNRYDLMKIAAVRNIKEYNDKFLSRKLNPEKGHKFLPYIVVIIDEFADLIQTAGREVEDPIARIAQLARAAGIHLIIATQRPSTNIITGSIKANFPARIAFKVSSMIDSRTILDTPGANQLIGRGDMLISMGSDLVRLQCAFIDNDEIERINDFIYNQQGYPSAFDLPEVSSEGGGDLGFGSGDNGKTDDLFKEAARLIVQTQQGSTSLIQRKFSIGYNRAGRIMDQLEGAGIVGPQEGSKPRNVLYSDLYALEQYLNNLSN